MLVTQPFPGEFLGSFYKRNQLLLGRAFNSKHYNIKIECDGRFEYCPYMDSTHPLMCDWVEAHTLMPVARKLGLSSRKGISLASGATHYVCPSCVLDDNIRIGTPVVHLEHMFGGVKHCGKHELLLQSVCRNCRVPIAKHNLHNLVECMSSQVHPDAGESGCLSVQYSKFVEDMLVMDSPVVTIFETKGVLRAKLASKGFAIGLSIDMPRVFSCINEGLPWANLSDKSMDIYSIRSFLQIAFFAYGKAELYMRDLQRLRSLIPYQQFPSTSWKDYYRFLN